MGSGEDVSFPQFFSTFLGERIRWHKAVPGEALNKAKDTI